MDRTLGRATDVAIFDANLLEFIALFFNLIADM